MCRRVFSVGFGPGLDSMSPARSWRFASHDAGSHDWLPKKTEGGTPTTHRLYPFGAMVVLITLFITFQMLQNPEDFSVAVEALLNTQQQALDAGK